MTQKIVEIFLNPREAFTEEGIITILKEKYGKEKIPVIVKKSLDARHSNIKYRILAEIHDDSTIKQKSSWMPSFKPIKQNKSVVIAGFGPSGIFAAIRLLEKGIKPVIIERGKEIKKRRRDIAVLNKEGIINTESNYCFGEGGAGTFSDGKLYTRSNKRGDVNKILEIFVNHGAKSKILYEAHPHIGTNKLPGIIEALRKTIIDNGGEVFFEDKLVDFEVENQQLKSVLLSSGRQIETQKLILATGHSSRDIFYLLNKKGIAILPKPFALGLRIEHPQHVIDEIQYHTKNRGNYLPPSSYSFAVQASGRGVFSFCMCPGGIIAPAATSNNEIVVNGWSPSKRNGYFANSGVVVTVNFADWQMFENAGSLSALKFQEFIEQKAFNASPGKLMAPAQKLTDFLNGKQSSNLPECSYLPGICASNLESILPYSIAKALKNGIEQNGKKMKGYISSDAVLVGVESRTSSPVKIPRDKTTFEHPEIKGLYPCGEGAGYAGGIVSAAIDGMACAERC
ncbi:MAG: NAD(P)/FAD-dependent oxidoreductase [Bacteroidetes bacterium]|nr:NAD(P)/FAD-dependent oxidoreductase [Bacteroidota bacterium]